MESVDSDDEGDDSAPGDDSEPEASSGAEISDDKSYGLQDQRAKSTDLLDLTGKNICHFSYRVKLADKSQL